VLVQVILPAIVLHHQSLQVSLQAFPLPYLHLCLQVHQYLLLYLHPYLQARQYLLPCRQVALFRHQIHPVCLHHLQHLHLRLSLQAHQSPHQNPRLNLQVFPHHLVQVPQIHHLPHGLLMIYPQQLGAILPHQFPLGNIQTWLKLLGQIRKIIDDYLY